MPELQPEPRADQIEISPVPEPTSPPPSPEEHASRFLETWVRDIAAEGGKPLGMDEYNQTKLEMIRAELATDIRRGVVTPESAGTVARYEQQVRALLAEPGAASIIYEAPATIESRTRPEEAGEEQVPDLTTGKLRKSKFGKWMRVLGLMGSLGGGLGAWAKEKMTPEEPLTTPVTFAEKFALPGTELNLPDEARPEEIEPRYAQVNELKRVAETLTPGPSQELLNREIDSIESELRAGTGWASRKLQDQFNLLLKDRAIRERLVGAHEQDSSLTLADDFSLLKAAIKNEGGGAYLDKLDHAIAERKEFSQKEIFSPRTERVIVFNYAAKDAGILFHGSKLAELARAAGVPEAAITLVSTGEPGEENRLTENAGDRLERAIEESRGNTTLYLNSHASDKELAIDLTEAKHPLTISVDTIARNFLNRIHGEIASVGQEGALASLGEVTLVVDGCKGYDFSKNLVHALRENYESGGYREALGNAPFEKIALPTIVTMAGEASPVVLTDEGNEGGSRALTRESSLAQIQEQGKLTGADLLKLQSHAYGRSGDMTFFTGEKGHLEEFSALGKPSEAFEFEGQKFILPDDDRQA